MEREYAVKRLYGLGGNVGEPGHAEAGPDSFAPRRVYSYRAANSRHSKSVCTRPEFRVIVAVAVRFDRSAQGASSERSLPKAEK